MCCGPKILQIVHDGIMSTDTEDLHEMPAITFGHIVTRKAAGGQITTESAAGHSIPLVSFTLMNI